MLKRTPLLLLSFALLFSWGCIFGKKSAKVNPPAAPPTPAAAPAPAPSAVIPREPAPLESAPLSKTLTAPSNFELGEMNFQLGNYPQAAKFYGAYCTNPKAKNRDLAMFKWGLSLVLAGDSSRDLRQSQAILKRLISEYPTSQYKDQAEFILSLQVQIEKLRMDLKERDDKIKKLSDELQALKDIDLQRRPSRPKE